MENLCTEIVKKWIKIFKYQHSIISGNYAGLHFNSISLYSHKLFNKIMERGYSEYWDGYFGHNSLHAVFWTLCFHSYKEYTDC